MVSLTPRFLFLAALVATAAMPSFVLHSDARALDLTVRHHNDKSSSATHSTSSVMSKGKGEEASTPLLSLPPAAKGNTAEHKKTKKHRKGSKKDDKRDASASGDTWDPRDPLLQVGNVGLGDGRDSSYSDTHYLLGGIRARDADRHHHHHHHERQDEHAQAAFILNRPAASRIYGKQSLKREHLTNAEQAATASGKSYDRSLQIGKFQVGHERRGSFSETHHLLPKRSPHHHHDHDDHDRVIVNGNDDRVHYDRRSPHHHHEDHDHDKVVVNGDNDDVHYHDRRTFFRGHHKSVTNNFGSNNNSRGASNIGNINERRAPHHHHDHHGHGKTVVNGNNDDVHVHDRRIPHHNHHHGEHDETVINGDNDNVHVHRDRKRSEAIDGVAGTVDIMNVGSAMQQKLASLVLSSVSDNSTTNSSFPVNGTSATSDPDARPFILDASNSTQTQFYLVPATKPAASSKSATEDPISADIKVSLQVPVFEPSKAAMSAYCATFDPNPPTPAPLTMEKCFTDRNASDASVHKSQTFAYNPNSGVIRPMWFSDSPAALNSSDASSNSTSNSTSGLADKQMNFKIPNSNKDAPVPVANVTQTVNGTAPSVPSGASPQNVNGTASPQNVTLVFTPAGPAVHAVNNPSDVASFEPADSSDSADSDPGSDSGDDGTDSNDDSDNVSSSTSVSSDSSVAMSTDSSGATTSTDSANAVTPTESGSDVTTASTEQATTTSDGATSNTTDVMNATSTATPSAVDSDSDSETMMPTSTVSDDTAVPTPTSTVDEAAIEKMYEQETDIV